MVSKIVLKVLEAGWQIDGGVKPCLIVKFFHHGYVSQKLVNLEGLKEKKNPDRRLRLTYPYPENLQSMLFYTLTSSLKINWKIIKQYILNIIC